MNDQVTKVTGIPEMGNPWLMGRIVTIGSPEGIEAGALQERFEQGVSLPRDA